MRIKALRSDERGISAVEMAIILPLLILLVMAIIEFGFYFVKYQIATRAVANISDTIQKKPAGATHELARQQGLSFLDLTNAPNFICAKSYADNAAANAGSCSMGEWLTGTPVGVSVGTPYYVAVRAYSPHISITPFTALSNNFPPPIDVKSVLMVNGGGWQNVPLTDTNPYNRDCMYRFRANKNTLSNWGVPNGEEPDTPLYPTFVATRYIGIVWPDRVSYIGHNEKTIYYTRYTTGGPVSSLASGIFITAIEMNCN